MIFKQIIMNPQYKALFEFIWTADNKAWEYNFVKTSMIVNWFHFCCLLRKIATAKLKYIQGVPEKMSVYKKVIQHLNGHFFWDTWYIYIYLRVFSYTNITSKHKK